jgi:hypothetical protein
MSYPDNNTPKDMQPPLEKKAGGGVENMNVNQNPRANENVPETEQKQTTGVGSEITDGESG